MICDWSGKALSFSIWIFSVSGKTPYRSYNARMSHEIQCKIVDELSLDKKTEMGAKTETESTEIVPEDMSFTKNGKTFLVLTKKT